MLQPEFQFNEWSCSVACLVWNLRKVRNLQVSQEAICDNHKRVFVDCLEDEESQRRGLLDSYGLMTLTTGYLKPRKFLQTNCPDDCKEYLHKHYKEGRGYLCGYVIAHQPTNHCMAVVSWDMDQIQVMNPTPDKGHQSHSWDELVKDRDADFLMFFA